MPEKPPKSEDADFNSIKVRLERDWLQDEEENLFVFQFHKGTIRTHEREAKYQQFANFNSIKVRLELCRFPQSFQRL